MSSRLDIEDYAMLLAQTASLRSEDPHHKVGAVAMSVEGRVIATGYNGLPSRVSASEDWWKDSEKKDGYVIHAEQNLCALFKRGEVHLVAVTLEPCASCFRLMVAHGVKRILFERMHESSAFSHAIKDFYGGIEMKQHKLV